MTTTSPHNLTPADVEIATAEKRRRAAEAKKLEGEQAKESRFLKTQFKRLEATIRTFLTADRLTEPQRQELVALLAGLVRRRPFDPSATGYQSRGATARPQLQGDGANRRTCRICLRPSPEKGREVTSGAVATRFATVADQGEVSASVVVQLQAHGQSAHPQEPRPGA